MRAVWEALEEWFPGYRFETEDLFACGDRCTYRWILPHGPTLSVDSPGRPS